MGREEWARSGPVGSGSEMVPPRQKRAGRLTNQL